MVTVGFPLGIPEMTKMYEDGDIVSLSFSIACIISIVLIPIFWFIYHLSLCKTFLIIAFISLILASIFLLIVYISRISFPSNEQRKQKGLYRVRTRVYKRLSSMEGFQADAFERLTPNQFKEYESYLTKKTVQQIRSSKKEK